jgi:hypothetical protein
MLLRTHGSHFKENSEVNHPFFRVQPMVQIAKQMRKSWVCDPSPLITTIPVYPDLMHLFISSLLQFSLQNRGCWHPKNLRFWRAILHPYFATKSKTWAGKHAKSHPFWTCLDCILVGPWFCKWGPQPSAGSAQNLTFWSWNWFCRDKACDTLRSLIF